MSHQTLLVSMFLFKKPPQYDICMQGLRKVNSHVTLPLLLQGGYRSPAGRPPRKLGPVGAPFLAPCWKTQSGESRGCAQERNSRGRRRGRRAGRAHSQPHRAGPHTRSQKAAVTAGARGPGRHPVSPQRKTHTQSKGRCLTAKSHCGLRCHPAYTKSLVKAHFTHTHKKSEH